MSRKNVDIEFYPEITGYFRRVILSAVLGAILQGVTNLFVVFLLVLGVSLVSEAHVSEGFRQELLLNLGSEMLGLFATFFLIDLLWSSWNNLRRRLEERFEIGNIDEFEQSLTSEELQMFRLLYEMSNIIVPPIGLSSAYQLGRAGWASFKLRKTNWRNLLKGLEQKYANFKADRENLTAEQRKTDSLGEITALRKEIVEIRKLLAQVLEQLNKGTAL